MRVSVIIPTLNEQACLGQHLGEQFFWQQFDIFGEQAEDDFHQEVGGAVGLDAAHAQALGDVLKLFGGLLGDAFGRGVGGGANRGR